jgi:3-deoxy-manno-octulosonate cytidylyltransferase (CMP-KDO synthetase)
MATAAAPFQAHEDIRNPSAVKVVWDSEGRALYFSRHPIPFVRDADPPSGLMYWRHIGIYAYRREFLDRLVRAPVCTLEKAEKLEQLRALHLGCRMKVVQWKPVPPGIDTPEDVAAAEREIRRRWPDLV